jgi:GNAT superfamily N-acetyltransferase
MSRAVSSRAHRENQVKVHMRIDIRPGDLGTLTALHGHLYADEYGWDPTFEAYVAQTLAEMVLAPDRDRHRLWIVEREDSLVGSIGIVRRDAQTAQLRWLLVHPDVRGFGIGRTLVQHALSFCREEGYSSVFLWTVRDLVAASRLYTSAGFRKTEEITHVIWGKTVTEQRYELDLSS